MRMVVTVCLAVACVAGWNSAQAQLSYTCRNGAGVAFQSSQPCASTSSPSSGYGSSSSSSSGNYTGSNRGGITYYGPAETPAPRYQPPAPRVAEAPSHIRYMSARCASLSDAVRTAYARGLKPETVEDLRRNYRNECAENESEARTQQFQEGRDRKQQAKADAIADKQSRERTALQQQQCGESKRILATKRARTDLTEGEKTELQRFEDNYRSRCG